MVRSTFHVYECAYSLSLHTIFPSPQTKEGLFLRRNFFNRAFVIPAHEKAL